VEYYPQHKTNCVLYKALLRQVLVYGSQAWTVSKNDEKRLWIFERKILRKIVGQNMKKEAGESYTLMK
jgi:hypothetical protein